MQTRKIFTAIVILGVFGLNACASSPGEISEKDFTRKPEIDFSLTAKKVSESQITSWPINNIGEAKFYFALKYGGKQVIPIPEQEREGKEKAKGIYIPFDAKGIVTEFEFFEPVQVKFTPVIDGQSGPVLQGGRKRIFENVLNIRAAGLDRSLQVSGQITGPDGETKNFTGPVLLFRGRKL